ncbi:hypothetical protein [Alteribacter populi]|nr:hypothetical protein [Alteribacter populi]
MKKIGARSTKKLQDYGPLRCDSYFPTPFDIVFNQQNFVFVTIHIVP